QMARKNFLTVKTKIMLEEFDKEVEYLSTLLNYGANKLIEANWNEENLIKFNKGYSKNFFEEKSEYLPVYTPSRAKYMIFELAAHTLKSQYQAHQIFNTIKKNCRDLNCDYTLFKNMSWSYVAIILRRIDKWNKYYWIGSIGTQNLYRTSLDTDTFFDFQRMPELNKILLPYSPTAKYMIKMDYEDEEGEIKLPTDLLNKRDWVWHQFEFCIHPRLKQIVKNYRTVNPTVVKKKTKSGLDFYEMNIPYQIEIPKVQKNIKRVLGVDLGIKKFATLCIIDRFEHDRPVFIKNEVMDRLKDLKRKASDLQGRLKRIPKRRFKPLHSYFIQVNNKFRNLNKQIAHEVSKIIVEYAIVNNCDTIALERLTGLRGRNGLRNLNWLISVWIRGKVLDYLKYKAKLKGIKVKLINPRYTSRYCSRCGNIGKTYKSSHLTQLNKAGGHFHCSNCGYNADRDYNASLNIGRLVLSKVKYIKDAKVVTYMDSTSLGNGSLKACLNMEKVLKSIFDKSYLVAVSPIQCVAKCTNLT
ncbi:MAG: RNA-guided endonuclease InsQ/TnpB family protein, partial [Methanosarcinales archaeon]